MYNIRFARSEKELKNDKEILQNRLNEVASELQCAKEKNREAEELKKQALNKKRFAENEAAMIKERAEETASAIINKALNNREVVGLIQKNALSIIRKEHPDIYKSAEKKAFKSFHSSLYKSKGENTLVRK